MDRGFYSHHQSHVPSLNRPAPLDSSRRYDMYPHVMSSQPLEREFRASRSLEMRQLSNDTLVEQGDEENSNKNRMSRASNIFAPQSGEKLAEEDVDMRRDRGCRKGSPWCIVLVVGIILIAISIGAGIGIGIFRNTLSKSSSQQSGGDTVSTTYMDILPRRHRKDRQAPLFQSLPLRPLAHATLSTRRRRNSTSTGISNTAATDTVNPVPTLPPAPSASPSRLRSLGSCLHGRDPLLVRLHLPSSYSHCLALSQPSPSPSSDESFILFPPSPPPSRDHQYRVVDDVF
ncbi:hypothetical protein BC829DRAFT_111027 [Chytridium lagenaria]|nr:hypothetical protein BC829DRAFT_111027 [Chytridium lagenaria]